MATKDISDYLVCVAYNNYRRQGYSYAYEYLEVLSGEPLKVCYRVCERADKRGYIDYGVSLGTGWLTEQGKKLLGGASNG